MTAALWFRLFWSFQGVGVACFQLGPRGAVFAVLRFMLL
jgi:hypothetical protein